jgi:hypothetical protein
MAATFCSPKGSLKAFSLHNGNNKHAIPVVLAVGTKETYEGMSHTQYGQVILLA